MDENKIPQWLEWAREIQSLSQTGLAFSSSNYETERYKRLMCIAAEIFEQNSDLKKKEIKKNFVNNPGYATPKIDVRAAVIRGKKILLVHEAMDQKWAMPGGWCDVGDLPSSAVVRETKEESGYDVVPVKVISVLDANRSGRPLELYHAFKIIFLCEFIGGTAETSNETIGVDFFNLYKLPPLSTNRTNLNHIKEIKEHIINPARATNFD